MILTIVIIINSIIIIIIIIIIISISTFIKQILLVSTIGNA